jgi:hypothetical protein
MSDSERGWLRCLGRQRLTLIPLVSVTALTLISMVPVEALTVISIVPVEALAASPAAPVPVVNEIDWRTSPLDMNLRGFNGERFRFHCPPGKPAPGGVVGSGPYTDGSSICAAATHAGVLHAASGGLVTIEVRPGQTHYVASVSHYVQSAAYEQFWSGSFVVIAPDAAA